MAHSLTLQVDVCIPVSSFPFLRSLQFPCDTPDPLPCCPPLSSVLIPFAPFPVNRSSVRRPHWFCLQMDFMPDRISPADACGCSSGRHFSWMGRDCFWLLVTKPRSLVLINERLCCCAFLVCLIFGHECFAASVASLVPQYKLYRHEHHHYPAGFWFPPVPDWP